MSAETTDVGICIMAVLADAMSAFKRKIDGTGMSNKLPQPTETLVQRLRRVAKWLDDTATQMSLQDDDLARWKARSNTCWQAAARLEEIDHDDAGNR